MVLNGRRRYGLRLFCLLVYALLGLLGLRWSWVDHRNCCLFVQPLRATLRGLGRISLLARGGSSQDEDDTWKSAYTVERDRNTLLREQLVATGLTTVTIDFQEVDLSKEDLNLGAADWESTYEALAARNAELEKQLRNRRVDSAPFEDRRDVEAKSLALFRVKLLEQEDLAQVELSRFFQRSSAFYMLRAPLPLGLNLTKCERGDLMGAFVVENVLPGGSAAASGKVLRGDILQALTVVSASSGFGSKASEYQEFLATVIGTVQTPMQELVDASFLDTLEDLVQAIGTNQVLGDGVELTLIFERDLDANPAPEEPLMPESF